LPESISLLVNLLIATFNMHFELTANQFDSMKASIDSLKQTIENLTKTNQELVKK
jgi:cell division protein FtsB